MIKAVIFDFDGVIVDTMPVHFKSWARLAHFLGFELDPALVPSLKGASRDKSLDIVLKSGGIIASEEQKALYNLMKDKWYQVEVNKMNKDILLPGLTALIQNLEAMNLDLAVASASRNASAILNHIGFTHPFRCILDARDIKTTKPAPDIFFACLDRLGVKGRETVVIEDSPLGIEAAQQADCHTIAIGSDPSLDHAEYRFTSIEEIDLKIFSQVSQ